MQQPAFASVTSSHASSSAGSASHPHSACANPSVITDFKLNTSSFNCKDYMPNMLFNMLSNPGCLPVSECGVRVGVRAPPGGVDEAMS